VDIVRALKAVFEPPTTEVFGEGNFPVALRVFFFPMGIGKIFLAGEADFPARRRKK